MWHAYCTIPQWLAGWLRTWIASRSGSGVGLAGVHPQVVLQRALLPELFGAVGTVVGLFAGVDLHVVVERGHLPEVHLADLALVRLLAGVRLDVIDQGALLREEPLAHAAAKRPVRIIALQHVDVAHHGHAARR